MNIGDTMNYDTRILELFDILKDHIDGTTLQEYRNDYPYLSDDGESSSGFLNHVFIWSRTKEGHDYWSRINKKCPFRNVRFSNSNITFAEVYSRILALYGNPQQPYEYW